MNRASVASFSSVVAPSGSARTVVMPAAQAVPDDMARLSGFVGTDDMVRDRLRAFRAAGITTVRAEPAGPTTDEKLATLERFTALVRELDSGEDGAQSEGGSDA